MSGGRSLPVAVPGPLARGTLGRQLLVRVVVVVTLLAVALSTVATLVTRHLLVDRIDEQLTAATARQQHGHPGGPGGIPGGIALPGQPIGTVVIVQVPDGSTTGAVLEEDGSTGPGTRPIGDDAMERALAAADPDRHVTADLGSLGSYRLATRDDGDGRVVVALPLDEVNATLRLMVGVQALVTVVAIGAALVVTRTLVTRSLRPLHRLARISRDVAETPLHTGVVELGRVGSPEAAPGVGSEVAELSQTMNAMLDHVESALAAREASESQVRTFVADASHELRNPLAAIRGYAELTRRDRDELPEGTALALTRIDAEAARMSSLVEDMLLLARLDAGTAEGRAPELQLVEVDLCEVAVNAIRDARASGPDHQWRLHLPTESVWTLADPDRLHQVVVNLLANARVHTPPGTTVEVRVDPGPDEVRISVTDDGPGIDPDVVDHVFERFTRADAGRSRQRGSTGLGLAIVAAVVEAHHGRVGVTSEPGRTRFTVVLPAAP